MSEKKPIYVSVDIETGGPIPGVNPLLSLGAAVFDPPDETVQNRFYKNLCPLRENNYDGPTMAWWEKHPEAWKAARARAGPVTIVIQSFYDWLQTLPGKPVFVGYPAAWDFSFVYWYLMRFVGKSPFGHSALDIKTLASVALQIPYHKAVKKNMPGRWFDETMAHNHNTLDDAIEQGVLFCRIWKELEDTHVCLDVYERERHKSADTPR